MPSSGFKNCGTHIQCNKINVIKNISDNNIVFIQVYIRCMYILTRFWLKCFTSRSITFFHHCILNLINVDPNLVRVCETFGLGHNDTLQCSDGLYFLYISNVSLISRSQYQKRQTKSISQRALILLNSFEVKEI